MLTTVCYLTKCSVIHIVYIYNWVLKTVFTDSFTFNLNKTLIGLIHWHKHKHVYPGLPLAGLIYTLFCRFTNQRLSKEEYVCRESIKIYSIWSNWQVQDKSTNTNPHFQILVFNRVQHIAYFFPNPTKLCHCMSVCNSTSLGPLEKCSTITHHGDHIHLSLHLHKHHLPHRCHRCLYCRQGLRCHLQTLLTTPQSLWKSVAMITIKYCEIITNYGELIFKDFLKD